MREWIPFVAIVCIAGLEGLAIWRGIDGIYFVPAVAAIAGLGGYKAKDLIAKIKGGK